MLNAYQLQKQVFLQIIVVTADYFSINQKQFPRLYQSIRETKINKPIRK